MSHRLALGAAAALLLALPAHASNFVCTGSPPVCSIPAGDNTSQAFLDIESPAFQASNAGNFVVTAGFGINAAVAVLSTAGGTSGTPSSDFQFTDTGSATLNGPSSIGASASSFQAMQLQSVGAPGASGQGGGAGGNSGTVTATLTNTAVTASFQAVTGGTYGLFAETVGGNGGSTDKDGDAAGAGGVAGTLSLSLQGTTVTSTPANNQGAAIFVGQIGGNGGSAESQSNANGGAGGQTNALTLTINGGGASFTSSYTGSGTNAAVAIEQQGGAGGALGDSSGGGQGGSAGPVTITLTDTSITTHGAAGFVLNQVGGTGGLANTSSTGGLGGGTPRWSRSPSRIPASRRFQVAQACCCSRPAGRGAAATASTRATTAMAIPAARPGGSISRSRRRRPGRPCPAAVRMPPRSSCNRRAVRVEPAPRPAAACSRSLPAAMAGQARRRATFRCRPVVRWG